ncbi:MAG: LysM peptidoglycan-binding domain-containing protein, partial [Promicromonosporaceae bacterium]|nr:LysM peptidoglycan-binding domain-containing protein [Promicromonosporaceae bacterium]
AAGALKDGTRTDSPLTDNTEPSPHSPAAPEPADGAGQYVVQPGDCLWRIAAAQLTDSYGSGASNAAIAAATAAWYTANRAVIGNNPNLIYPYQVLTAPPS